MTLSDLVQFLLVIATWIAFGLWFWWQHHKPVCVMTDENRRAMNEGRSFKIEVCEP